MADSVKRSVFQRALARAGYKKVLDWMPDKLYLQTMFWARMGTKLDLANPKTLNEKVQWLKLYDRNPLYTELVDKYAVRAYIKDAIGEEYLIPLLGGPWTSVEQIEFEKLPEQFVLKTTHDCGGVAICTDRTTFDVQKAKERLTKSMKCNYFYGGREYPYKNVEPRLIAEKYITEESLSELRDYKILCLNGKPQNIMVCTGRSAGNVKYYFFDWAWNFLPLNHGDEQLPDNFTLERPNCLDEMFKVAQKLSAPFKLVRVDLYETENKIYFGELTFYPDSGFDKDILPSTDAYFGSQLSLK